MNARKRGLFLALKGHFMGKIGLLRGDLKGGRGKDNRGSEFTRRGPYRPGGRKGETFKGRNLFAWPIKKATPDYSRSGLQELRFPNWVGDGPGYFGQIPE